MNAKDQFKLVTQKRGWHGISGDVKAQNAANYDKHLAASGRLSYEKCVQWLERLGYTKLTEEEWIHPTDFFSRGANLIKNMRMKRPQTHSRHTKFNT